MQAVYLGEKPPGGLVRVLTGAPRITAAPARSAVVGNGVFVELLVSQPDIWGVVVSEVVVLDDDYAADLGLELLNHASSESG